MFEDVQRTNFTQFRFFHWHQGLSQTLRWYISIPYYFLSSGRGSLITKTFFNSDVYVLQIIDVPLLTALEIQRVHFQAAFWCISANVFFCYYFVSKNLSIVNKKEDGKRNNKKKWMGKKKKERHKKKKPITSVLYFDGFPSTFRGLHFSLDIIIGFYNLCLWSSHYAGSRGCVPIACPQPLRYAHEYGGAVTDLLMTV